MIEEITMTREVFSAKLKDLQTKANISLYQLAQMFSTGAGTISRWINNHAAPPEVARVAIIKKLEELLKGKE
jgi:transcriptional regulator with XRE-family HTH domain